MTFQGYDCYLLCIRDATVMHCVCLLFWVRGRLASYSRSMASSLVDFVSKARGITFYCSIASFWPALYVLSGAAQQALFELRSLDVLSGHQKLGHLAREAAQFLAPLLRAGLSSALVVGL